MVDVLVIGAGFSGLIATRDLFRKGKKVLLLEARNRVGGRVETEWISKETYIDLGGQWIGPTQDHMYALLEEYNTPYFATHQEGQSMTYFDDKLKKYKGLIPPLPVPSLLNLEYAIKKINRYSKKVNMLHPGSTIKAEHWEIQTLAQWMNRNIKFDKAKRVFKIGIESIYACDPSEISLLHTLFYCKSGQDLDMLLNIDKGAQQDRIYGGAQTLAEKIAHEFQDSIQFNSPVVRVHQNDEGVVVHTSDQKYNARKLVVAIPPPLISKIKFSPSLPDNRQTALETFFMGSVIKCYAVYDRPFWRDLGLNGLVATDGGFVSVCFDNSPRDAEKGMIMGFVLADKAKKFMELRSDEREEHFLSELVNFFGPKARNIVLYKDKIWAHEEWSEGCYAGMKSKGGWTQTTDQIYNPIGDIHWAGTETSTEWYGYMEGAVIAGKRAAKEVLDGLNTL